MAPHSRTYYSTPEAAAYLDVSASTLNKWRIYGCGPEYVKFGRIVRYSREALDRFAADRRRRSTSEAANVPAA